MEESGSSEEALCHGICSTDGDDHIIFTWCALWQQKALSTQVSDFHNSTPRGYLVLGCLRKSCGKQPGSWRAYSFPQPGLPLQQETPPASTPDPQQSPNEALQEDWGAEADSWGAEESSWGGALTPPPSADASSSAAEPGLVETLDELGAQLGLALNLGVSGMMGSRKEEQEPVRAEDQSKRVSASCQQVDLGSPVLPEFYLCQEAEPGAPKDLGGALERHIAKLLKQYNQENPQQVIIYSKHLLQA